MKDSVNRRSVLAGASAAVTMALLPATEALAASLSDTAASPEFRRLAGELDARLHCFRMLHATEYECLLESQAGSLKACDLAARDLAGRQTKLAMTALRIMSLEPFGPHDEAIMRRACAAFRECHGIQTRVS